MATESNGRNPEAADATAAPTKKKATRAYVILAVIVVVGIAAYFGWQAFTRGKESTDDAQVDADVVPIASRVSGTVLKVHVVDNQMVKKGDLLVEIDPVELAARAKQADAELAAAKAQAASADAQVAIVEASSKGGLSAARAQLSGSAASVGSADSQVASAQAAVARAEAESQRADQDLARAENLLKDQAIPQAQVDTQRSNAAAAHAALAQARAQLQSATDMKRAAQTRVSESQAHVEQSAPVDAQLAAARANADLAHARVASAEASLTQAQLNLQYTRIVAPVDGMLSKLAVHDGQLVQPGQQVVAVVPNTTYVIANFKETQVGEMKPGQRVSISVDAYGGREFEGVVTSTSPGTGARFSLLPPDNATGNFVKVVQRVPVRIAWKNLPEDVHVAAGMSADVTVHTK
ncbi:MAG TPA: HlyD family secretion protein [Labilithrix sp.]